MALLLLSFTTMVNAATSSRTVACSFVYVECKSRAPQAGDGGLHFISLESADRRLQVSRCLRSIRSGLARTWRHRSLHVLFTPSIVRRTGSKAASWYSLPPGNRKSGLDFPSVRAEPLVADFVSEKTTSRWFRAPGLPAFSPVLHRERETQENRQRYQQSPPTAISQEMLFQSTKQNFLTSIHAMTAASDRRPH